MEQFRKWMKTNYTWIALNFPAFIMVLLLALHPSFRKEITFFSGYFAVGFLFIVLVLNPLQMLIPTSVFLKKLNRYRRQIGVAVFSYVIIHLLCFLIKRDFDMMETIKYFLHPALIPAIVATIIFALLALTSNNYSVKKMGFLKWKKLHKFVYVAEAFVFLHMVLVGGAIYAFLIFIPLVIFQIIRKIKKKKTEVPY